MSDQPAISPQQNSLDSEADCYVSPAAETTLNGVERSVLLYGPANSGKTTLMCRFRQARQSDLFFIDYPLVHWPAKSQTASHTDSIMGCAADALERFIAKHPNGMSNLTPVNLEYVRWLLDKYLGGRATRFLADAIGHKELLDLTEQPYEDLYPSNNFGVRLRGQISELVTIVRRLGFDEGVAVMVDIGPLDVDSPSVTDDLPALFDWLEVFAGEGFSLKIAMPDNLATETGLVSKYGRLVTPVRLQWNVEDCHKVANCHLAEYGQSLQKLATPDLLEVLEAQLSITCGGPIPLAWGRLAQHLLDETKSQAAPLPPSAREAVLHRYFEAHIPLRLDVEGRGVWRGAEFIPLTEQPFNILHGLWRLTSRPEISWDARDAALMRIAGKRGNLNTIARRLRESIEPAPNAPIYLHNTRAEGYWLECIEPLAGQ